MRPILEYVSSNPSKMQVGFPNRMQARREFEHNRVALHPFALLPEAC